MPINKTFTDTSTPSPTLFYWDFGDGTPPLETAEKTVIHQYELPGKYTVTHRAGTSPDCWSNICTQEIDVAAPPTPAPALGPGIFLFLGIAALGIVMTRRKKI